MAVTRTVLPRKGIIQSAHAGVGYEADEDANELLLDTNVVFLSDLLAGQLGINGVASGFTLSTSGTLTPGLAAGVLFAQGEAYAPTAAPSPGAAPASATSYLFYNSSTGFYYQASGTPATAGDALIGTVTTSAGAVTNVVQATRIGGVVAAAPSGAGNFSVAHLLGRAPVLAVIQMTSAPGIWFQAGNKYDGANLNLVASGAGVTADVIVF
jgi:hypothetical protein